MDLLPRPSRKCCDIDRRCNGSCGTPTHDIEMSGQTIPAGKLVLAVIGSANRDPQQFPDPSRFNISRDPNPHLAFGNGIHFCMGAPLARLEAKIALTDLLNVQRISHWPATNRGSREEHCMSTAQATCPFSFDPT